MSSFQAAAAMAVQAQMSKSKNQVGTVSDQAQIQQIQQISAPAVGALAPLVMPVPDYESANTLKQALEAINNFGNFAQQRGAWLGAIKNDQEYQIHLEKQQQTIIAGNALNKFKEDQATDILQGFDATEANKNPQAWAANKTAPYLEGITDPSIRLNLSSDIQMGLAHQFASAKVDARQIANENAVEQHRKTNEFQNTWSSELEIETNGKNWKQTLQRESEQPQAWIESRITQAVKGLKERGVTDTNAIESFRNNAVQALSNQINPYVKQKTTEAENENLKAIGTAITVGKREISVDEIASQTGKSKQYVIENLLPTLAQNAAINKDPELMKRVVDSLPEQDKFQNIPILKNVYDNTIAQQKKKIATTNEELFAEAQKNPDSKDAINTLEQTPIIDYEGRSLNKMYIETYALDLMKSNPGNMENIIKYENKITSEVGKQQYETIRNHAGKLYEESTAEWIRQKLRSGEATPEETMAQIKERGSRWIFANKDADPLSPGRQILGSLNPTTVRQLEGEMGELTKTAGHINAFKEYMKTNGTSEATSDVKAGGKALGLYDGSDEAVNFALQSGMIPEGAENSIYTNQLNDKNEPKDVNKLLQISQLQMHPASNGDAANETLWQDLKEIANSPNRYTEETKKNLVQIAIDKERGQRGEMTVEKKRFQQATTIAETYGIDSVEQKKLQQAAFAKGISNNDASWYHFWGDGNTYDSLKTTRAITPEDDSQIKGDAGKYYLDGNDKSQLGYAIAYDKATEEALKRLEPIRIGGEIVGRVNKSREPAWNNAYGVQIEKDFGDKKVKNIQYFGISQDNQEAIYAITTKDHQTALWQVDVATANKQIEEDTKNKTQRLNNIFLGNERLKNIMDRPSHFKQ